MLSYRVSTVNDFHWGFKPVLSAIHVANFTHSQHCLEKKTNMHVLFPTSVLIGKR